MIGDLATLFLMEFIESNDYNRNKKEQALDAIGAIAYKYNDLYNAIIFSEDINININTSIDSVDNNYINEKEINILIWKIVRSLSGFKNNENALNLVINIQKRFINIVEIQWEAIRSIGQIAIVNDNVNAIFENFNKNISN